MAYVPPGSRLALVDLELTLSLVAESLEGGPGAFGRAATLHGTHKVAVGDALGRVEKAFGRRLLGGEARRTAQVTAAGRAFVVSGGRLAQAWRQVERSLAGAAGE